MNELERDPIPVKILSKNIEQQKSQRYFAVPKKHVFFSYYDSRGRWDFKLIKGPLPVGDSTFPEILQSDVKYTTYTPQTQLLTSVVILSVSVSYRMYKNSILCMLAYPNPWDRTVKSVEIQLWNPIFLGNFPISIFSTTGLVINPPPYSTTSQSIG